MAAARSILFLSSSRLCEIDRCGFIPNALRRLVILPNASKVWILLVHRPDRDRFRPVASPARARPTSETYKGELVIFEGDPARTNNLEIERVMDLLGINPGSHVADIRTVLGRPEDSLLPRGKIDAVLLLKTYHEIARPINCCVMCALQ